MNYHQLYVIYHLFMIYEVRKRAFNFDWQRKQREQEHTERELAQFVEIVDSKSITFRK